MSAIENHYSLNLRSKAGFFSADQNLIIWGTGDAITRRPYQILKKFDLLEISAIRITPSPSGHRVYSRQPSAIRNNWNWHAETHPPNGSCPSLDLTMDLSTVPQSIDLTMGNGRTGTSTGIRSRP